MEHPLAVLLCPLADRWHGALSPSDGPDAAILCELCQAVSGVCQREGGASSRRHKHSFFFARLVGPGWTHSPVENTLFFAIIPRLKVEIPPKIPPCDSGSWAGPGFPERRPTLPQEARKHLRRILPEAPGDFDELQKIHAAFAGLDLPHERVRPLELAGELPLGQTR